MQHLAPRLFWVVALGLGLTGTGGCGDDTPGEPDGAVIDAAADAGDDGGATQGCEEILVTDQTFALDPQGPDTQIHAAAAFDGETVWVVYNLPDQLGSGGFDVYALRLRCDGSHHLAPFVVNTTREGNDVDPDLDLDVAGDRVYVTWTTDTSIFPNNMDVYYRSLTLDGEPVMATDRVLDTTRDGTPVPGNVMSPDVTALGNGRFAVAAIRGLDDASGFQAFAQRLTDAGDFIGEAVNGFFAPAETQTGPQAASLGDGHLFLAWTRSVGGGDDQVVHTRLAQDATVVDPAPPALSVAGMAGTGAHLAVERSTGLAYLAFGQSSGSIVLKRGDEFDPGGTYLLLGTVGFPEHSPVVAPRPGGGAVFFYRNISGIRNEVWGQTFTDDGNVIQLGTPWVLPGVEAIYYRLAATHITGNVYLIAWSEGTSPNLRLMGRFVELPGS